VITLIVAGAIMVGDRLGLFGRRPDDDFANYHSRTFLAVNVVDGDTLDVDEPDGDHKHTRIRLWGVDTPETKHPHKGVQHFGRGADAFTRAACSGKQVRLELLRGRTRGKYGRLLAYVILPDGRMLNRELLRQGCAYADPRFDHPRKREFSRLQDEAMRSRTGLWQAVQPEDLPYYYEGKLRQPATR
jgi:micrococcal nuclease